MSAAKNVSVAAKPSQEVILQAHEAVMAALDQMKALVAEAQPLEAADLGQDKAARDRRWEVSVKMGSMLVRDICTVHIHLISQMCYRVKCLANMGRPPCTYRRSCCRLLPS
jgi:hypothetical protein